MKLQDKVVVVAGGAGFIGSHIVDALIPLRPAKIIVLSNFFLGKRENLIQAQQQYPNLKVIEQDLTDFEETRKVFEQEKMDVVFNLAMVPLPTSLVKPAWTYRQNINITLNLCELSRAGTFQTLIQFSSSEAYGTAQYIPMDENHPIDPTTPYAASKAATDHIALTYSRTFGIEISIIRPFNTYGPRQNAAKFAGIIPLTIKRIMQGEDVVILGDGEQTRDYIYVTDTAQAAIDICCNTATRGKVINIGSGRETSINNLVSLIASEMNYKEPFVKKETRPGDVKRHLADISLAKNIIGFSPKVSLEEGIPKTVAWYKKQEA